MNADPTGYLAPIRQLSTLCRVVINDDLKKSHIRRVVINDDLFYIYAALTYFSASSRSQSRNNVISASCWRDRLVIIQVARSARTNPSGAISVPSFSS